MPRPTSSSLSIDCDTILYLPIICGGALKKNTAFVTHTDFDRHHAPYDHPECPDRTRTLIDLMNDSPLRDHTDLVFAPPAEMDHLEQIHSASYLKRLGEACRRGDQWFDYEDTYINRDSFEVALLSAGGCIEGVRLALSEGYSRVFCSTRPPGHHAGGEQGMGFCLLNNVAISARYAQHTFSVDKIMIIDWDAHHGNGTQHLFEDDRSVYYVSIHEHPTFIFPGTGRRWEVGKGKGAGYTMNIPLPPGAGDDEYIHSFETLVIPALRSFAPELIFISAGFDGHRDDPLSDMNLTEEGYRKMTSLIVQGSKDHSNGKIVSMLEGGYNLGALKESVRVHIEEMTRPEKEEACSFIEE